MEDNKPLIIRQAKKGELPLLVEVYKSAYHKMEKYAYKEKSEIKNYLQWLYRRDPRGLWVIKKENKIIGFACIHTDWQDHRWGRVAEMHEIAVREEFQGEGMGEKLLEKILIYAREKSCKFISLWVGKENQLAYRWYIKMGFRQVGTWGNWIRMRKRSS